MRNHPLSDVLTGFEKARGQHHDETWAGAAVLTLAQANVATPVIRDILTEALTLVEESQESPEQLFGPARAWATDQVAERRSTGEPVIAPDPQPSWREVPVLGLVTASVFALVFMVIALVKGHSPIDYTVGMVAFPVLAGLGTISVFTTWEKMLARRPVWVAALSGTVVLIVVVASIVILIFMSNDHPFGRASAWRLGFLALACALAASFFDRVLPESSSPRWNGTLEDEEWESVTAGILRLRADMPESRVRTLLAEARAHAVESSSTLQEEFGRPEDYASRFTPDVRAAAHRKALFFTAMTALGAVLAFPGGFSWNGLFIFIGFGVLASAQWLKVHKLRNTR